MKPFWHWLLVGCIFFGVGMRFVGLESLVYWHDEAYTSLRIAGSTAIELHEQLFTGDAIAVDDLMRYQRIRTDRTLADTINSLITEDVQHPPLYYALLWGWAKLFGSGIGAIRSFSAAIGVLILPAAWWLGWELFRGGTHGSASRFFVAFVAISPYQLLFAQEAREYVLWTLTTMLSSAALARSLRLNTWPSWFLYTLTLTAGLYTHLFTVLTVLGHGLYGLSAGRKHWRKLLNFAIALAVAGIAFIPWLSLVLNPTARQGAGWTAIPVPLAVTLKAWANHLLRAFTLPPADGSLPPLLNGLLPGLVVLLVYSLVYLIRKTPITIWGMPVMLMGSAFLPLALLDLLIGGQRSLPSRYLIPLYTGLLIPVAFLFAQKLMTRRNFPIWSLLCGLFIGINLFACLDATRANTAWTKDINHNLPAVVETLNSGSSPLLVGTAFGINTGTILALSHYLKSETRFQLIDDRSIPDFLNLPTLPEAPGNVFLLNGSLPLRLWLEHQNGLKSEIAYSDLFLSLWRFEPESEISAYASRRFHHR